jgi:hypothetical protein
VTRAEGDRVEDARAEGRPTLSWVGMLPLRQIPQVDSSADCVRRVQLHVASGSALVVQGRGKV